MHSAKVVADSIAPHGIRLTSLQVVLPRIVLAEFNTHRAFSRNSASSRAIPVKRMLQMVQDDPYVPSHWGKNQKGMQAGEILDEQESAEAVDVWMEARMAAIWSAQELLDIGVHKQLTNRLLEPFMWHTVLVTATEWDNFFNLRINAGAHPDIRMAAEKMKEAMDASTPRELAFGQWHLPYIKDEEREELKALAADGLQAVSAARSARLSYLTQEGVRDLKEDLVLYQRLLDNGHLSPFEHPAKAMVSRDFIGNFCGWLQLRKEIHHEWDILGGEE